MIRCELLRDKGILILGPEGELEAGDFAGWPASSPLCRRTRKEVLTGHIRPSSRVQRSNAGITLHNDVSKCQHSLSDGVAVAHAGVSVARHQRRRGHPDLAGVWKGVGCRIRYGIERSHPFPGTSPASLHWLERATDYFRA